MVIQQLDRNDAEKVFIIVDNGAGATIPAGGAVIWETTSDANGLRVVVPTTAHKHLFAGIMDKSMASVTGSYTLMQVYGYRSSALYGAFASSGASQAEGAAQPVVPVNGQHYLTSAVTTTASTAVVSQIPLRAALAINATVAASTTTQVGSAAVYINAM